MLFLVFPQNSLVWGVSELHFLGYYIASSGRVPFFMVLLMGPPSWLGTWRSSFLGCCLLSSKPQSCPLTLFLMPSNHVQSEACFHRADRYTCRELEGTRFIHCGSLFESRGCLKCWLKFLWELGLCSRLCLMPSHICIWGDYLWHQFWEVYRDLKCWWVWTGHHKSSFNHPPCGGRNWYSKGSVTSYNYERQRKDWNTLSLCLTVSWTTLPSVGSKIHSPVLCLDHFKCGSLLLNICSQVILAGTIEYLFVMCWGREYSNMKKTLFFYYSAICH